MSSSSLIPTAVFPCDRYGLVQPRADVTADIIVQGAEDLVADPGWQSGFTEVWDMRFTPSIDVLPNDIPALLAVERRTKAALEGSTTLVVTYKPLILYTIQFYARLVKPLGRVVHGVDTAAEAAAILGVNALPDLQEHPV